MGAVVETLVQLCKDELGIFERHMSLSHYKTNFEVKDIGQRWITEAREKVRTLHTDKMETCCRTQTRRIMQLTKLLNSVYRFPEDWNDVCEQHTMEENQRRTRKATTK